VRLYSRDGSVSLSTESWATSASSVTSPGRRRYDNSPRDSRQQLVPTFSACGRDASQLVSADVIDAARRHDLAAAAAAAAAAVADDDVDATSSRHNEMTRTAVRPWLLH